MGKTIFLLILGVLFLGMGIFAYTQIDNLRTENKVLFNNIYAMQVERDSLASVAVSYYTTIKGLKNSVDSIDIQLREAYRSLGKKDKEIAALQYVAQTYNRVDTVSMRDTIFIEDVYIDTTLVDKYASVNLKLKYPNSVIVDYTIYNEIDIVTSRKRVYVNGRSGCFLIRWFQKKHTLQTIDVVNQNPHVVTTKTRFYEIIK